MGLRRVANEEIARRCGVDSDTVGRWRSGFAERGMDGVGVIAKGGGRKPSLPPGTAEAVLRFTHKERPAGGSTHWSTRSLAARVGIGKDAVAKIWADHNLKPWKVDTLTVSGDPRFQENLFDVVGTRGIVGKPLQKLLKSARVVNPTDGTGLLDIHLTSIGPLKQISSKYVQIIVSR